MRWRHSTRPIPPTDAEAAEAADAADPDWPTKQDCPGCRRLTAADPLGRPPIGFCGPDCELRKARDRRVERQRWWA